MSAGDQGNGGARAEFERVARAACEQIELAVRESQPSVDQLGEALQRLADLLAQLAAGEASPARFQSIRAEMARAVASLQFHDRLTQHLAHVSRYLLDNVEGDGGSVIPADWDRLHRRSGSRRKGDPAPHTPDIELF